MKTNYDLQFQEHCKYSGMNYFDIAYYFNQQLIINPIYTNTYLRALEVTNTINIYCKMFSHSHQFNYKINADKIHLIKLYLQRLNSNYLTVTNFSRTFNEKSVIVITT